MRIAPFGQKSTLDTAFAILFLFLFLELRGAAAPKVHIESDSRLQKFIDLCQIHELTSKLEEHFVGMKFSSFSIVSNTHRQT